MEKNDFVIMLLNQSFLSQGSGPGTWNASEYRQQRKPPLDFGYCYKLAMRLAIWTDYD